MTLGTDSVLSIFAPPKGDSIEGGGPPEGTQQSSGPVVSSTKLPTEGDAELTWTEPGVLAVVNDRDPSCAVRVFDLNTGDNYVLVPPARRKSQGLPKSAEREPPAVIRRAGDCRACATTPTRKRSRAGNATAASSCSAAPPRPVDARAAGGADEGTGGEAGDEPEEKKRRRRIRRRLRAGRRVAGVREPRRRWNARARALRDGSRGQVARRGVPRRREAVRAGQAER